MDQVMPEVKAEEVEYLRNKAKQRAKAFIEEPSPSNWLLLKTYALDYQTLYNAHNKAGWHPKAMGD